MGEYVLFRAGMGGVVAEVDHVEIVSGRDGGNQHALVRRDRQVLHQSAVL